jgi:hypothetical protein
MNNDVGASTKSPLLTKKRFLEGGFQYSPFGCGLSESGYCPIVFASYPQSALWGIEQSPENFENASGLVSSTLSGNWRSIR